MIVLCDQEMLDLLAPTRRSRPLITGHGSVMIAAEYDDDELLALTDEQVEAAHAWWREAGYANIEIQLDRAAIAEQGVLLYLCDTYGISTEKNIALALGEMARGDVLDPIELWDWCADQEVRRARLVLEDIARVWPASQTHATWDQLAELLQVLDRGRYIGFDAYALKGAVRPAEGVATLTGTLSRSWLGHALDETAQASPEATQGSGR